MLRLVREIARRRACASILSSHLLRDVEECCDEVIVLKDGQVATIANLAAERASQRRFLEIETRGDRPAVFVAALSARGCEVRRAPEPPPQDRAAERSSSRELYRLAAERGSSCAA